jgi:hypothetical protein
MTDFYKYNTQKGIIVPDTAEVKTEVENEWYSNFGGDFNLQASTPQGRLVEMETLSRVGVIGLCALVANQINLDYATGQFLDAIGAFYGVERKGATRTRVLTTITGVAGTVIPAGSLAQTTAGDRFFMENETTIPNSGSITSYFLAEEYGAVPCATGTLTTIISQTIGWETISNPASADLGEALESDTEYKKRIKNARYTGASLLESIKGKLQLVDNVKSSFVYDNGENTNIVYDGITIAPHSLLVVVDGGANSEVARAIFNSKSCGCGYTSITGQAVTEQVVDGAFGVSYAVVFNRPEILDLDVVIDVRANEYTGTDLEGDVKNAILNWESGGVESVDGLKIGQNASPFEIGSAVSEQLPSIYVKSVKICLHGGTPATNELTCTVAQIYSIALANITVNVV